MQVSKKLPQQQQQPQQRCTMRGNTGLIFIVLFFIAATTLLQLPTLNYIKYLTVTSNESQIVTVKNDAPSSETSKHPLDTETTRSDKNIDDDNDEDDDTESKNDTESDDENDNKVGTGVSNEEEPNDGDDDDNHRTDHETSNEPEKRNQDSPRDKGKGNDSTNDDDTSDDEPHWEKDLSPKIVWLASYPNSGTSYTMTLVERASNVSTATNYGNEVTLRNYDSLPIYPNHEVGPFWEGSSKHAVELNRIVRNLPTTFVLTKTHCGGRCIKCPASEYLINTTRRFIYGCQKTSYRKNSHTVTTEYGAPMSAIKKLLHLIRNPYHNVVARFHLERKNMISKDKSYEQLFTYDAAGFKNYCHYLDTNFNDEDETLLPSKLYKKYFHPKSDNFIPCAAEFYKWVQWHNYAVQSSVLLGLKSDRTEQIVVETDHDDTTTTAPRSSIPVHVIWYESYEFDFNATFAGIMDFLQFPVATEQIRTFRSLPTYDDHFTLEQRTNVHALIQKVAIPSAWKLIKHYFE